MSRFVHIKYSRDVGDIHENEIEHIFGIVSELYKSFKDITDRLTEYINDRMIPKSIVGKLTHKGMNIVMYILHKLHKNKDRIEPSIPIIKYLIIECNVDPSSILNNYNTLDYALELGNEQLIQLLVTEYKVKPSAYAVKSAVSSRNPKLVMYAIQLTNNNNTKNIYKPIWESVLTDDVAILDIMVNNYPHNINYPVLLDIAMKANATKSLVYILKRIPNINKDTLIVYMDKAHTEHYIPSLDVVRAIYEKNKDTVTHIRTGGRDTAITILLRNTVSEQFMEVCKVVEYLFGLCNSNTKAEVVIYIITKYTGLIAEKCIQSIFLNYVVKDENAKLLLIRNDVSNILFDNGYYNVCNAMIQNGWYTVDQMNILIYKACGARIDSVITTILTTVKSDYISERYSSLLQVYLTVPTPRHEVKEDPIASLVSIERTPSYIKYNINIIKILCSRPSRVNFYAAFISLMPNVEYNQDIFEYFSTVCDTETIIEALMGIIPKESLHDLVIKVITTREKSDTNFRNRLISRNILGNVCTMFTEDGIIPKYIIENNYFNDDQLDVVRTVSTPIFRLLVKNSRVTEYICKDNELCMNLFYEHTSKDIAIGQYMMSKSYAKCITGYSGMLYERAMSDPYNGINIIKILFNIQYDNRSRLLLHSVMTTPNKNGSTPLMMMAHLVGTSTVDERKFSDYLEAHIAYADKHPDVFSIFTQVDTLGMNLFTIICKRSYIIRKDLPLIMNQFINDRKHFRYIYQKNQAGHTGYELLPEELKTKYAILEFSVAKA